MAPLSLPGARRAKRETTQGGNQQALTLHPSPLNTEPGPSAYRRIPQTLGDVQWELRGFPSGAAIHALPPTYTPNAVTPLLRYRPHPVPSAHLQQAQPTGGRPLKPMTLQDCSGI